MRSGRAFWVVLFVAVIMAGGSLSAKADDVWIMRPVEKLGRGITNVAFGVFEIPMKWSEVTNDKGGLAGLTYGTLKGVCYTVAREVVGVVDIVTFIIPLPNCPDDAEDAGWGYGPIMTPEWVVPVESDWNEFIYRDEAVVNPAR